MQQRALIATVMVANPRFLIADEPTASLDKVTERQIVMLLQRLQHERRLGFLMISHDIGIVSSLCQEVVVIYKGNVVEQGPTGQVLSDPEHPYTKMLVRATKRQRDERGRLTVGEPLIEEATS
jgi:ABC-type dipeptide/oligopeptide/nickel transport system ATPase component